ncbi:MAG: helical backbone metal receptor [Weeksellaceae bacterium]|jgi:ABC-type Fe3+-hydroxamate transport system substrate-binding protein|nr:helical backbone metal receptor [Weeksellaceae bacterium]
MKLTDQLGRIINFEKPFSRIISLVPSQTELLVDLGLEKQILGLTKFCVHPPQLRKQKLVVGGTKEVNFDKIKELRPDIILCNKEENTKEMVEELSKEFTVHVSDVESLQDNYELIEHYGILFNREVQSNEINIEIQKQAADFQKFVSDKPLLKVVYFIWRKPWMVVGGNTFVNHLLEFNKFENAYSNLERYPEIHPTKLINADFYLLSSEPFPFAEKHKKELQDFAKSGEFVFVDGEFFSWYGSRLIKAFGYFRKLRERLSL